MRKLRKRAINKATIEMDKYVTKKARFEMCKKYREDFKNSSTGSTNGKTLFELVNEFVDGVIPKFYMEDYFKLEKIKS